MNKLFLLAHPKKRFEQDFFTRVLNSPSTQTCSDCKRDFEADPNTMELAFYWDTEFGRPNESFKEGHQCFWGEFRLIVSKQCKERLSAFENLFKFKEANEIPCQEIPTFKEPLAETSSPFFWVFPKISLCVHRTKSEIELCSTCGKFRDSPQQTTRIRVNEDSAREARCFTIQENRAFAIFVTEELRNELTCMRDVKGIGFYPAGSLV